MCSIFMLIIVKSCFGQYKYIKLKKNSKFHLTYSLRFNIIILSRGTFLKRYNSVNKSWILFGFLIPILFFYLFSSVAYAYFTASAKTIEGAITTGIMKVAFSEDTEISVSAQTINGLAMLPGDSLTIKGSVENVGSASMYALLQVDLNIESSKNGDTINYTTMETRYYTVNVQDIDNDTEQDTDNDTELVYDEDEDVYTTGSTLIANGETKKFKMKYKLDGNSFDSDYQGKAIQIVVTVYAIQIVGLNDGIDGNTIDVDATNIMLGKNKATI